MSLVYRSLADNSTVVPKMIPVMDGRYTFFYSIYRFQTSRWIFLFIIRYAWSSLNGVWGRENKIWQSWAVISLFRNGTIILLYKVFSLKLQISPPRSLRLARYDTLPRYSAISLSIVGIKMLQVCDHISLGVAAKKRHFRVTCINDFPCMTMHRFHALLRRRPDERADVTLQHVCTPSTGPLFKYQLFLL